MRILIIAHFFPPRNSLGSQRAYSWARYWSKAGHDVTVVTTQKAPSFDDLDVDMSAFTVIDVPWLPESLLRLTQRTQTTESQSPSAKSDKGGNGFLSALAGRIMRAVSTIQNRYGIFYAQRFPDLFLWWRYRALQRLQSEQPWDVVISTHGPYATHILAHRLKERGRVTTWIADYRDLWTDHHVFERLWPFYLYEVRLERKLLRLADAATTVSAPLAATLMKRYRDLPVHVVENGFEPADLAALPDANYFPADGVIRFAYTGWIQAGARDPSPLFAAVQQLHQEMMSELNNGAGALGLEILFVGPQSEYVQQLAESHGATQYVRQVGVVPRSASLQIQRDCDVLLFLEFESESEGGLLSGKIFEYLTANTLILAIGKPADDSIQSMLTQSRTGIHLATDVEAIKAFLRQLLTNKSKPAISRNDAYIAQFTRENKANTMLSVLTSVWQKNP